MTAYTTPNSRHRRKISILLLLAVFCAFLLPFPVFAEENTYRTQAAYPSGEAAPVGWRI